MEGGVAVKMRLPRFINPYIVSVVLADFGYSATHQNCSAEHWPNIIIVPNHRGKEWWWWGGGGGCRGKIHQKLNFALTLFNFWEKDPSFWANALKIIDCCSSVIAQLIGSLWTGQCFQLEEFARLLQMFWWKQLYRRSSWCHCYLYVLVCNFRSQVDCGQTRYWLHVSLYFCLFIYYLLLCVKTGMLMQHRYWLL